ncbi:MAG: serine/threonine-protein kinase [Fuerstiella sp.]
MKSQQEMSAAEASDETSDLEEDSSSSDSMNAKTKTLSSDDSDISEATFRLQPERIGHFQLQHVIGTGGFGIVYQAIDTVLGRTVAIKVPRDYPDDEAKAMFLMEARAVARLDHAGIVKVYDAGKVQGQCYQVSTYCSGGNLAALLESEATFSWQTIAKMIEQLAHAMQHAHQRGIVHRDLKPANIVLAEPHDINIKDFVPELRITDFGLARIVEIQQSRSQSSQLVGTPSYMAPEQFCNSIRCNPELSDIYSLGVIFYELLTGQKPYDGKSFIEVVDQIRNCSPQAPSLLQEGIPAELEIIALKCMSEDPANRYASCQELAMELKRFINGEPIHSYRPSRTDRLMRWLRSPKRMIETGFLSIIIGVATPLWIFMILVAVVLEGLEADVTAEMIPQALLVCSVVLAPLIYIGNQTRRGHRKWFWAGLVFSVVSLCLVAPPLFGDIYVFPKLYERYPLGRIIAYSLLSLEHLIQVVQYSVLLIIKRDQFARRATTSE